MKKFICACCNKEIKENEQVARFYNGNNSFEYTHVLSADNKYDCDYVYMMESLNPAYFNNINEADFEEEV